MSVKKVSIKIYKYSRFDFIYEEYIIHTKHILRKKGIDIHGFTKIYINVKRKALFYDSYRDEQYYEIFPNPLIVIEYYGRFCHIYYKHKSISIDITDTQKNISQDTLAIADMKIKKIINIITGFQLFLFGILIYKKFIK